MLSSGQLVKQRLRLFQIERVKPFGEPAVDRSEKLAGLIPLALMRQSRAMLVAARSSQDFACCWRATASETYLSQRARIAGGMRKAGAPER